MEQQVHGFPIDGIEVDAGAQHQQRRNGLLEALHASVRQCHAIAEAGAAQTLASDKTVEDLPVGEIGQGVSQQLAQSV